ncbi:glycosyltransferase [Cupriavidus sp. WKF15]|uniref:glycosyltransferase family 8 protein n=1 Tax=Cupriavidus sp. WKF15 TaxID=3032282 RepID=UPI0023E15B71|nr:glycosyltransferase [Cupriavidus sp. WKF15]WER45154.1 glycosyltransferase [Cupriavidus sp. WKF15]
MPSELRDVSTLRSGSGPVHVAFGVDAGYYRGMGVTITSVLENNPGLDFVFHVFAFSITADNREKLEKLEEQHDVTVRVHLIDTATLDDFRQFPCFSKHSLGTFIRLLIPSKLSGIADQVLYLDADLLCFGDLSGLLAIDLGDCIAAAVADEKDTTVRTQIPALGLKHGHYFNAGVMYIDVQNWIAADVQQVALKALTTLDMRFADQDALNIALDGRVRFVDTKWNYRYHLVDYLTRGETKLNVSQPYVFMHFTGPVKPWHSWCLHDIRELFTEIQSRSPWAETPLDGPGTARELKLFSRFLITQHRIAEGVYWHCRYLRSRLMQNLKSS